MILKDFRLSKRALSPIFGTLSLLAIVMILFVPIFAWSTNMTNQVENDLEVNGVVATESIVIEEVSLNCDQSYCTIYVRNIGSTTVSIDNVLIETDNCITTYQKSLGEIELRNPETGLLQDTAASGQLLSIRINDLKGLSLVRDNLYIVKVFTTNGIGEDFPLAL